MAKKIFDILPPDKLEETEVKEEEVMEEEGELSLPEIRLPSFKGVSVQAKPMILFLSLALVGAFCYFYLPRVTIEVYPESEISNFKTEMTVDKDLTTVYAAEKIVAQEFPATGTAFKENKAIGIIRVYNAYSTSPQILVVNTRFISTEGKLFRITKRITVPGGHYQEGELVPGFLDVQVRADQPGEEFNIGPSTFSIPGFAGTARYTFFYGKSFQSMAGGFKKQVSQVTQDDLDQAKSILEKRGIEESQAELKEKALSGYILLEKATRVEALEVSSSVSVNQEAENFTFRVKAKSSVIAFKEQDVKDFVVQFISSEIPSDKKIHQESLSLDYRVEEINFELSQIKFSLNAEVKIYSDIDESCLKNALKGKTLNETELYLKNYPEIRTSSVQFWPFWVKKVPQNNEKIRVELKLD